MRHAEEGRRVVEGYVAAYYSDPQEVEAIAQRTFARNVVLARYFPNGPRSARRAGITSVDVHPLHIPFHQAFAHARMDRDASDAVLVRVTGKDGSYGYGEGLPRPYVTGESVDGMVDSVLVELAPLVRERTFAPGIKVLDDLRELRDAWNRGGAGRNATYCAVELALLDWAFRRAGLPLSDWLAPKRREVVYSGVVEAADPSAAAELARRYASAGLASIKVKVGVGDDERRLAAVREAVGQDVALRVDANGAWSAEEAVRVLARLSDSGIEAVAQPVAAADLAGMRRVREESGLLVVADESLVTVEDGEGSSTRGLATFSTYASPSVEGCWRRWRSPMWLPRVVSRCRSERRWARPRCSPRRGGIWQPGSRACGTWRAPSARICSGRT